MAEVTRVSVEIAGTEISFETGRMARQASGAVVVRAGDTIVLNTAGLGMTLSFGLAEERWRNWAS